MIHRSSSNREEGLCVSYDAAAEPWFVPYDQFGNTYAIGEKDVEAWAKKFSKDGINIESLPTNIKCDLFKINAERLEFISKYVTPELTRQEPLSRAEANQKMYDLTKAKIDVEGDSYNIMFETLGQLKAAYIEPNMTTWEKFVDYGNETKVRSLTDYSEALKTMVKQSGKIHMFVHEQIHMQSSILSTLLYSMNQPCSKVAGTGVVFEVKDGSYPVVNNVRSWPELQDMVGSEIITIDGVETLGLSDLEVRDLMRGPVGTEAVFEIRHPSFGEMMTIEVPRRLNERNLMAFPDQVENTPL